MWTFSIIPIFLCLCLIGSSTGSAVAFIDLEPVVDIEPVLAAICSESAATNGVKLGRQSTILALSDYVNSPTVPSSELTSCVDQYRKPLQELAVILRAGSNENLCSKQIVDKISKFHWDYIVASLSRKWRRTSDESIPEPLRVFFLHYTSAIAEKCTATLIDRLQAAVSSGDKENQLEVEWLSPDKKISNLISQMSSVALIPQNQVVNYDSFLLLWNQITAKARRKGVTLIDDDLVVGSVKLKDPTNLWALQRQCRNELRPHYQNTVLPVMSLFELGYGKADEQSRRVVSGNRLLGNWYTITQLCELLLPLKFYRDQTLKKDDEFITLAQFDDGVSGPGSGSPVDQFQSSGANTDSLVQLEDLLLSSASDLIVVKHVKTNLDKRNRLFKQILKNMVTSMRGRYSSKLKNLFLSKEAKDGRYTKENAQDILEKSNVDIGLLLEEEAEDESTSLRRIKREYLDGLYGQKRKPIGSWPKEKVPLLVGARQGAKVFFRKAYVRLLMLGMMFISICISLVEFLWR